MLRYSDPWWATLCGLIVTGLLAWGLLANKDVVLAYLGAL